MKKILISKSTLSLVFVGVAAICLGLVVLGFQSKTQPNDETINRTFVSFNPTGDKAISYQVQINAEGAATVTKMVYANTEGVQNKLCFVGRVQATQINAQNQLDVWLPQKGDYNYYYLPFAEANQQPQIINLGAGSDSISGTPDATIMCHCYKQLKNSTTSPCCHVNAQVEAFNSIVVTCTEKNECVECGIPVVRYNGKISTGDGLSNALIIRAKSIVLK